ncbi:MAG: hypothetical protein ABIQ18_28890 [Umezawaea sp.]
MILPLDYSEIPGFENLYLEDSFVMDIVARPGELTIIAELVLTPGHHWYAPPKPGEQYCYRRGSIRFSPVSHLSWSHQGTPPAVDAGGESDFGGIDSLRVDGENYFLEGDWGQIELSGTTPVVLLTS